MRIASATPRAFASISPPGRIGEDELSDRLDAVYEARTLAELKAVVHDLPALPVTAAARRAELAERRVELRRHLVQQAGGALTPFVICAVVWAASGATGPFWPAFLLIFPALFLVRNGWRLYGPAPDLDRVQLELGRGPATVEGGAAADAAAGTAITTASTAARSR